MAARKHTRRPTVADTPRTRAVKKKAAAWNLAEYRSYPLIDGMLLHVAHDVTEREAVRFAGLFVAVWLSMASVWRNRVRDFWRRGEKRRRAALRRAAAAGRTRRPLGPPVIPFLTLESESIDHRAFGGTHRGDTQAIVTDVANTLRFLRPYLRKLSDRDAKALIAHEGAHVVQWVARHDPQTILPDGEECEQQASDIALGWGHSVAALEVWEDQHVKTWKRGLPVFIKRRRRRSKANK